MGGRDIEVFDASQDSLSLYAVPLSIGVGKIIPVEQVFDHVYVHKWHHQTRLMY